MSIKLTILAIQMIFAGSALIGLISGLQGKTIGLVIGFVCGMIAFALGILNLLVKVPA